MSQKTATKKAVARKDMTRLQWTWKEMKRNWVAYLMIAPFCLVFTLFTMAPVVVSIFMSFTDFNMIQIPNFLFLDNYIRLFLDDDIFLLAVKNTLIFAVIVGPVSYLMSLMVAWFINELGPRIRAIVTLIFYAPSIAGQVYLIWGTLFSGDSYGWVNATLLDLGLIAKEIQFFEEENTRRKIDLTRKSMRGIPVFLVGKSPSYLDAVGVVLSDLRHIVSDSDK